MWLGDHNEISLISANCFLSTFKFHKLQYFQADRGSEEPKSDGDKNGGGGDKGSASPGKPGSESPKGPGSVRGRSAELDTSGAGMYKLYAWTI